jgi:hypothetical protein
LTQAQRIKGAEAQSAEDKCEIRDARDEMRVRMGKLGSLGNRHRRSTTVKNI